MKFRRLIVVLSLMGVFAGGASGEEYCAVDGPASVLACLESAYAARDADQLAALLAPDYRLVFGEASSSWDRASELESSRTMFGSEGVTELTLRAGGKYSVSAGATEGTWQLEGVTFELRMVDEEQGEHRVVNEGTILLVREVMKPTPHYEIVEWCTHRGEKSE